MPLNSIGVTKTICMLFPKPFIIGSNASQMVDILRCSQNPRVRRHMSVGVHRKTETFAGDGGCNGAH